MVATLAQATSDLQPYLDRLRRCVEDAIREFLQDQSQHLWKLDPRTQANILRDYMVKNIKAEFPEDEPGVTHRTRRGLFLLNIQNRYFLRFKKLDNRLRTRNHPTQMSLDYLLQQPLTLFPDLEAATHLNVGYHPGSTVASASVWMTCPDGDVLDWKLSLSESEEPALLIPRTPSRKVVPATKRRVRPKPLRPASTERDDGPDE